MDKFAAVIKAIGVSRIIGLILGLVVIAALTAFLAKRVTTPPLTLLYGGLNSGEAAEIVTQLDTMGITYEVRGSGTIYVPKDRVGELRLQLAGSGTIGSSNSGYEIFDNQSSFGTTSLVQNLNAKRALEGELARTISSMPSVQSARVHLVIPKQRSFSREKITPTAAVAINVGSRIVPDEQINSITQLVAAAVPNLNSKDVTVVDQRGNLLTTAQGQEGGAVTFQERIRRQIEQDYENNVTAMLEKVVGVGSVAVKVTADMDFKRVEELSETYDPEGQVARSEQTSEDTSTSNQSTPTAGVGVAGNTPDAEGGNVGSNEEQARTETTTNYEISKNVRRIMNAGGAIERLSVAVLVESNTNGDPEADGYTPIDETMLAKLKTLVERAIGFDEARGDKVEIIDLPFTEMPELAEGDPAPMFGTSDYIRFAEIGGMVVLGILILLFMIRPLLKTIAIATENMSSIPPAAPSAAQAPGMPPPAPGAVPAPGAPPAAGGASIPTPGAPGTAEENSMIDMEKVEGRVKESTVKKVHEIVDQYPDESVQVVRNWLADSKPAAGDG